MDGTTWSCSSCAESGFTQYLHNDPIYKDMELWVVGKKPVTPKRPTPTEYYMNCGDKWVGNTTWTEESLYDYFAVVNADEFEMVATEFQAIPSSDACEAASYVVFAPICNDDPSCADAYYGPQEYYFKSGETFSMKVKKVSPPAPGGFDFIFNGAEGAVPCNYQLNLKSIEIVC